MQKVYLSELQTGYITLFIVRSLTRKKKEVIK